MTTLRLVKVGVSCLWLLVSLAGLVVVFPAYLGTSLLVRLFEPVLRWFSSWDITETQKLHKRLMDVRRVLLWLMVLQWSLVLVGGLVSAAVLVGWPLALPLGAFAFAAAMLLLGCSSLAGIVLCYYSDLLLAWQAYPMPLCEACGYVRAHPSGNRCPECGSDRPASSPGRVPQAWQPWELSVPWGNEFSVHAPVGLVAMTAFLVPLLLESGWASEFGAGVGILLATLLIGTLSTRACLRAHLAWRITRPSLDAK